MELVVNQLTATEKAKVNVVFLPRECKIDTEFCLLDKKYVFKYEYDDTRGNILLNKIQRKFLGKQPLKDSVAVQPFPSSSCGTISFLKLEVDVINLGKGFEVDAAEFQTEFHFVYDNAPFNKGQKFYFYMGTIGFLVTINGIETDSKGYYGMLAPSTNISFIGSNKLSFINNNQNSMLLNPDFDFESLGIGGLKQEFSEMFRRAFVQRVFEPTVIRNFGIPHVKGIMLYGPPGTGKTLIARKLGSLLNAKPPKIVNGPEILNKYVGESEQNIRNLFKDAEDEWRARKERSQLHIIIFDEIDAICKRRGSSSTGVGDQVVNQLLSKIDGVEALENILVIGMTNRLDLIDEALLRPGRFEIHLEISLPDEKSRYEIFRIHTRTMENSKYVDSKVDFKKLAQNSKNYTGAEITAVVKSAVSYALDRKVHPEKKQDKLEIIGEDDIKVYMDDFLKALNEIKPAFGLDEMDFFNFNKPYYTLTSFTAALETGKNFVHKLLKTNLYSTSSLLFYGPSGTGKTTLAVKAALGCNIPFIKIISPKDIIGLSEQEKVNYIKDKFMDAYKSEEAIIILDDLESLINYVRIGPMFSNQILQAIKVLIKAERRKKKVFVFGTTSEIEIMEAAGIYECFYGVVKVDLIDQDGYEELCLQNGAFRYIDLPGPCSIKHLLSLLDEPEMSPN